MMKRLMICVSILAIVFASFACSRKEEKKPAAAGQVPVQQQGHEGIYGGPGLPGQGMVAPEAGQSPHSTDLKDKPSVVVVPDFVKGKWRGVVLTIEDKKNNKKKDYEVKLNSEFTIPDSNIIMKTGEFLPAFVMDDKAYTSRSNNPENPGVNLTVVENGKEIFKGWVFSKFPTIHPFMHNRFGITLKEGVKAS